MSTENVNKKLPVSVRFMQLGVRAHFFASRLIYCVVIGSILLISLLWGFILADLRHERELHVTQAQRNTVIVLLSYKAGLRACEIAGLSWPMVVTATGEIAPCMKEQRADQRLLQKFTTCVEHQCLPFSIKWPSDFLPEQRYFVEIPFKGEPRLRAE